MKLHLTIELNLPENEELSIKKNVTEFCEKHVMLKRIKRSNFQIAEAEIIAKIPVTECGFPDELLRCLRSNCIFYLQQFQKFRFSQIYHMISDSFNRQAFGYEYALMIHEQMMMHGIPYSNYPSELLVPIRECGLSVLTAHNLIEAGYTCLQDVADHSRAHIFAICYYDEANKANQEELDEKLREYGLWYSDN